MKKNIIEKLTTKDDKCACALADKIISESQKTDEWYEYFDDFASLLDHPKSLVRNRALYILAANAKWDENNRFDSIISDFIAHITDEKPITARQCIKALAQVGTAKPQYIPRILLSSILRFFSCKLQLIITKENTRKMPINILFFISLPHKSRNIVFIEFATL